MERNRQKPSPIEPGDYDHENCYSESIKGDELSDGVDARGVYCGHESLLTLYLDLAFFHKQLRRFVSKVLPSLSHLTILFGLNDATRPILAVVLG